MTKVLVVAVIVLALTSLSLGHTSRNAVSNHVDNPEPSNTYECSTLTFITESLPDFTVGEHANFQIVASGGTPPYNFDVTSGTLPANLKLKKDGTITGKPGATADTTVFVKLTDSAGCTLTQAFAVRTVVP